MRQPQYSNIEQTVFRDNAAYRSGDSRDQRLRRMIAAVHPARFLKKEFRVDEGVHVFTIVRNMPETGGRHDLPIIAVIADPDNGRNSDLIDQDQRCDKQRALLEPIQAEPSVKRGEIGRERLCHSLCAAKHDAEIVRADLNVEKARSHPRAI